MSANMRLLGSGTGDGQARFASPEEKELHRKREKLGRLQTALAEAELELATRRSELLAFERRYMEVVGSRYAELDRLESVRAEAVARRKPADTTARREADAAHARAQESAEAMGDVDQRPSARPFEPSEELKTLFRQAAKELHPDLTTDEQERARRQRAMAELNEAYETCDAERIRHILAEWRSSPEHVRGDDTAAQLVRVIREIAQARKRLGAIKTEIEELTQAELARLKKQMEEAAARGQDLLAEIAAQLDAQIEQARAQLEQVSTTGARP